MISALASITRVFWPAESSAGRAVEQGHEVEIGGELPQPRLRRRDAVELGVDAQVLAHRQAERQVDVGRGEVDPAAARGSGGASMSSPSTVIRPALGSEQAEQHGDRGGLAGAVGAEQRGRGAARHGEAQAVDGEHLAVALAQARDDDRRRFGMDHRAGRSLKGGTRRPVRPLCRVA